MKAIAAAALLLSVCQNGTGTRAEQRPEPNRESTPQQLEADARALARTEGCSEAGACRTAPVGVRPCGGPRDYLVYCATSTDTAALFAKLAELKRVEEARNRESGMMSTCEYRLPPGTELVDGTCHATPANQVAPQ